MQIHSIVNTAPLATATQRLQKIATSIITLNFYGLASIGDAFTDFAAAFSDTSVNPIDRASIDFAKIFEMAKTFGYVDNLTDIFKSGLLTGKQINALSTPSFYTSSNSYSSFVKALILNNSSLSAQAIKDLDVAHYRVLAAELAKSPSASDHFIYFLNASSSAQVGILTATQFKGADTKAQTWLLTNRYKDLSSAVIGVLTKDQLEILIGGKPLYQQLSPAQVGILTTMTCPGIFRPNAFRDNDSFNLRSRYEESTVFRRTDCSDIARGRS